MSVPLSATHSPQWREKLTYLAYQIRRSPLTMAGLLIRYMLGKGLKPILAVDADANANRVKQQPYVYQTEPSLR